MDKNRFAGANRPDKHALRVIPWIVAIAFFMQMLDTSIMNTALPSIAGSLGENPVSMHWAVIAYLLTLAVFMPISGWAADRLGTRRVLGLAIIVFSLGSLFCALSTSLPMLVAARVAQGLGGAFMVPVGRLMLLLVYPRRLLVPVLSFVSIPGLIGPLLGPTLGGFLVQAASWHWIFLINLPVGLLGCLAVLRYIPDLRRPDVVRFDLGGFLLFGLAMLLISFALDSSGRSEFSVLLIGALAVGGLLCIGLYVLHARRHAAPLFRLDIFRIRSFSVGIWGNIFARLAAGGMPYMTPMLLQLLMGYPPFEAGLIMIPLTVMAIFSKAMATRLLRRFGYRKVLLVNTMLLGGLIASFSAFTPHTPLWAVLGIFCVFGAVNSLQHTSMNTLTLIGLPDDQASSGNSLLSVVMQLAASLGVTASAALLAAFMPPEADSALMAGQYQLAGQANLAGAFHLTYLCMGIFSVLAALIFLYTPSGLGRRKLN
ncbi:MAG: multidrug transporter subunit MdtD [Deltaproteobacteria bacterium]|jgi:EmrB/QacA subfamily drug resistance transporter|nr:multidrug transporter subunit MdtD [Deltaproteobacteria bacterium]